MAHPHHLTGITDSTVIVRYDGTNFGRAYLSDVGKRRQLGGAVEGVSTLGQDQYLSYGQDTTFVRTSQVMLSIDKGVIGSMIDKTAFTVLF
jgi:hypothetical protein